MALSTIEEKRKRKEAAAKQLTPTTDPFLASIARGDYTPPKPVVKQAKPTPGNIMNESFYGGSVDINTLRRLNKQDQTGNKEVKTFSGSEPKASNLYEPPTGIKVPTLKELPNAQRDSELGKMNVGVDGNIVTYDIGGNTLSYDASQTDPSKISLRNINKSSGNAPTWDDYHAQQTAKYNAYMNAPRGRYFGPTPLPTESPESSDKSLGGLFLQGLQARKDRTYAQIENDIAGQDINRAEAMTQANRNLLMADSNRISEMDVLGQNKLRDIQGQVAQQPVAEENKPVVLDSYEPNPINPAETLKKQRVVIRDAEGNFIDVTPKPTFTESQEEIAEKLSKMRDSKDPRLAAAEAKYKAAFGNLPY